MKQIFAYLQRFSPWLWRIAFASLAILCMAQIALIWLSGGPETNAAFDSGRRILIKLEDGSIEGHINTATPPPAPVAAAPTPSAPPAESPPAEAAKPAEPAPAAAVQSPPAESPPAPTESPSAAAAVAPPATTPPAESPPTESPAAATTENAAPPTPELPTVATADQPPEETAPVEQPASETALDSEAMPSGHSLPEANPALTEKAKTGTLPAIGSDGTKPWRYYAKPFTRSGNEPMIAIIVTGLGENKHVSDNAIRLPEAISLSFSPYAKDITTWGTAARAAGHEALIDLPLQPANYPATDPGPYGLLVNTQPQENETKLEWVMERLPVYVGFLTPQNEAFSASNDGFKLLLQSLANRGLLLVMGREPAKDETKTILESTTTANVVADALIDEDLSATAIQARLTTLEQLAKKRGYAVGIAQGLPITLEQLHQWAKTLHEKGITLVPISAIARLRFS